MSKMLPILMASAIGLHAAAAHAVVGVPQPRQDAHDLIIDYVEEPAVPHQFQFPGIDRFSFLDRIPGNHAVARFRTRAAMEAALAALREDPNVESVEIAELVTADFVPSDPLYPQQWDKQIQRLELATDIELGDPNVLVVVVDSVAECTSHPDLAPNCRQDLARDFTTGQTGICRHGWHVAGIAAASIDNGVAIAGTAGRASIVPLRFLGSSCSGSTAAALEAFNYVLGLAQSHRIVVNNSWGGGSYNQTMQDTVAAMRAAGIVTVASAGNGGADNVGDDICVTPVYPASYAGMTSVAATDPNDQLPPWSNFGACASGAEVAAPGTDVISTCEGSTTCILSGTSMAAPQVAGLAALILSIEPELSADDVELRIMDTVVPVPALSTKTLAGGRIDLPDALSEPEPGIRVALRCDAGTIPQEDTLSCDVPVSGRGGFEGEADLSCSGVPNAQCTITPATVQTGATADLQLTPSTGTPLGVHVLVVDAVADGVEPATAQLAIEVEKAGTTEETYSQPSSVPLIAGGTAVSSIAVSEGWDVARVTVRYGVQNFPWAGVTARLRAPDGTEVSLPLPAILSGSENIFVVEEGLDGVRSAGEWQLRVARPPRRFGMPPPGTIRPWSMTIRGVPF